ncbi:Hypothetical predicted protein [Lecanosticta acicola]|uniref:Lytic polysaccharide monooxygenase n=1 Tax=Lecanosticta acicola TaxID=111012 RepID=A0AAI9E9B2_9PEZI|nr:Hypothetical predicted protein [Lecanosticta acicola]
MIFKAATAFLASSFLLGTANAHLFIATPEPIEGTNVKPPLDASGSDFPCHGVKLPFAGKVKMPAGSTQKLSFDLGGGANTAVHGGGSCQMSVTYETDPAKLKDPASWHVIYSIEGGCPSDTKGNLPTAVECDGTNSPDCVNSFNFTIPKGLKNGKATLAWTWFNSVGNREIYMNCIDADITGGDGSEMASLPSMFVANLASIDQCPTTEQYNVKFPDPGKYVTTHTQGNPYPLAVPTGPGCSKGSASGTNSPSPYTSSAAATTSSAAPSPSSYAPASSSPSAAPSSTENTSSSAAAPTATGSSGTCPDSQVSCPTPGDIICVDSTHFGICDVDNCAIPMDVAAGTTCANGKISKRWSKRDIEKHRRRHTHGAH